MDIKGLEREFEFNGNKLPDINAKLSPEEVMAVYANTYPELNNGKVVGPEIKDEKQVFTFKTILGEKG